MNRFLLLSIASLAFASCVHAEEPQEPVPSMPAQTMQQPQQQKRIINSTSQLEDITLPIDLFHAIQQYLESRPYKEVIRYIVNLRRVAEQEILKEDRLKKAELAAKKKKDKGK